VVRSFSPKSVRRIRCIAAAALALSVGLAGSAGSALAQAGGEPKVSIALIPVVVHSAEDPAYLRAGLTDMLVSRLEQAGLFEVTRIADRSTATTSLAKALEVGRAAGADFVLFGSFTRFGQGASLDMQCASTALIETETLREIFVHSGSIGDVIPDLDELVGKVSRFAVDDFEALSVSAEAGGSAAERVRPSESKLRRRIEVLERESRETRHALDDLIKKTQQPPPKDQR
jgi:TolB-like protein